jgi:hypothetical protein
LKSQTGNFEGCEIRNLLNLAYIVHGSYYLTRDVIKRYPKKEEVCFGMIFSYFAIDIMDIYGPKGM